MASTVRPGVPSSGCTPRLCCIPARAAVGSFVAPLVCQSIIATGIRWANFYFGSLVLSALNTSFIIYAFWPTQSELKGDAELASQLYRTAVAASDVASSFVAATPERSPTSSTAPIVRKKEALGPRSESFYGSYCVLRLTL